MTDESFLISRIRQGDYIAFRDLYEHHVDPLYRFLKQFSRDHHQVEDWVQRSFIKAYESLDRFAGRSRFSTWLFTIGLNEMRSDRRKTPVLSLEETTSGEANADDAYEIFEWEEMMRGWLDQLDDVRRSVFLLHEVEGFSHAEIAQILQIGESTSRTILSRTRQWLKMQWNKERAQR
ncbi:MAG: RNA polymerase sigma factor [Bacteroidota bacterium]